MVLACRSMLGSEGWSHPSLWALVFFLVFVALPIEGYLLYFFPDWVLGYWFSVETLPFSSLFLLWPLGGMAIGGYFLVLWLLRKRHAFYSWTVVFLGVCALVALGMLLGERFNNVGTYAAFSKGALKPIGQSSLGYFLFPSIGAVLLMWGFSLWRLYLLARAFPLEKGADPTRVRSPPKTQPPKARRQLKTLKKNEK